MTKKFCKQCGNALTKAGAKFCTTCGATVDSAGIGDISAQETRGLPGEQTDQTAFSTEVIPAITPMTYETEEMPRMIITARVEERSTEVIEAIAPTTPAKPSKKPTEPAQEKQAPAQQTPAQQTVRQPGGRKKLALAAVLGVGVGVALVAAAFFIINSRRGPEAQAGAQTVDKVEPSPSAQPIAPQADQQASTQASTQLSPPSAVGANNQAQSQTRPQPGSSIGEVKSPVVGNDESASNSQRQAAAKPTPTPTQEKQAAAGTSAAEHRTQGITYMTSGRLQDALQEFENMKKLDPGNKDVYYLLGLTYQKMNQLERALEAYRQCTSGDYASVSQSAVKNLEKRVGKVNAR